MHRNQKGFLIALFLCMLSLSGIFGVYQYRKGLSEEPKTEAPKQEEAQSQEEQREAANSRGTVAQADTEEEKPEQAKIDTEEDIYKIGEAELAKTETETPDVPETPEEEAPEETEEETEEEESVETVGEDVQSDRLSFAESSSLVSSPPTTTAPLFAVSFALRSSSSLF